MNVMIEADPNDIDMSIKQVNNTIVDIKAKQRFRSIVMVGLVVCIGMNISTILPAVGLLTTFGTIVCSFAFGHFFSTIVELENSITTLVNVVKMLELEKKGEPVTDGKQTGI